MKNAIKITMLVAGIILVTTSTKAQGDVKIKSLLVQIMDNVRENKYENINEEMLYKPENSEEVLKSLQGYYSDTLYKVRSKAYSITNRLGMKNKKDMVKQQCVVILLNACKDKDSGIIGVAGDYLKYYPIGAFTSTAKDSLRSLLRSQPPHYDNIIKLAGYLELTDQIGFLRQYISAGKNKKATWAAHLALARMGEATEMEYLVSRISKLPVNDDVVYELLPDLAYTRQKKAIDYLIDVLNSDEKNCESSNPELGGNILCGYRVMEMLAPVIKDFPLKVDESGDIVADDYKKALITARQWMAEHKGDYEIIRDTF